MKALMILSEKWTDAHATRLSELCAFVAQVALASVFVPYIIDTFEPAVAVLGLVVSSMFWIFSLFLVRTS